jgi:phage terminase large subunit
MKISKKYLDFVIDNAEVDILEGTTAAGKTTTAINTKFLYKVKTSSRKKHLIAGDSIGTVVSNILSNGDCGLLDNYPNIKLYLNGNADQTLPHINIDDDIVYLVGYSDVSKFKKVLGGQFGAVFIDECNIADMGFIRELFLPRFEYCCMTLNPDNPDKEIYAEIINRARPTEKYANDVPAHIWEELKSQEPNPNWRYWFFGFDDNPTMTEERKGQLYSSLLPETREYQTKILGKRAKGTGLIFILPKDNIISEEVAKTMKFNRYTMGIDTSYSQTSKDTFAFIFGGINDKTQFVVLEEMVFNNSTEKASPSDIAIKIDNFIDYCNNKWGVCNSIFVDSADQATISECRKFKQINGRSYNLFDAYKKTSIIDRINLQNGWIAKKSYLIVDTCKHHIKEHNTYSWLPNKDIPEDANDHSINASQYAWLPYKTEIGK